MIAYLKGALADKGADWVVVETAGVGYEVFVAPSAARRCGAIGEPIELFISESTAMYGGGTTLYGFLTRDEKDVFAALRDHVPSTGAKKALEYLDKASKSLPDFRRAVLEGDQRILTTVFGFTAKTAEKILSGLRDKLGDAVHGRAGAHPGLSAEPGPRGRLLQQAMDALIALGYKPLESRQVLEAIAPQADASVEDVIRKALKTLSGGMRAPRGG